MKKRLTIRGLIFGTLGLQVILAGAMLSNDFRLAWPNFGWPSSQPRFDTPVFPGDQTRRYNPSDIPLQQPQDGNPDRPFRSTGDMPIQLQFTREGDVLNLTGSIAFGDDDRIASVLDDDIVTVRLNSPGGSVQDALAIGRRLRAAKIQTVVGAQDVCLSACPYVLAAGTERRVHNDGQVGVHQHYFGTRSALPAFLAVEQIQNGQAKVMIYLSEMGVDPLIMQHALSTPSNEIYILLSEQLATYKLATHADG